ncbi:hypothetical protein [Thalassospira marina]|uniref:hypothetical protein n=1 Tax=Thalassospira marina TaxID=2048283 RepID=UPI001FE78D45|nr:hypothetical protein [Thalassospira marina]
MAVAQEKTKDTTPSADPSAQAQPNPAQQGAANPAAAASAKSQAAQPAAKPHPQQAAAARQGATPAQSQAAKNAQGQPRADGPPVLEGNVDAIDRERLFGWVWCPQRPDAQVDVIVRMNGHTLLKVKADRERIDLRRNGIGNGKHAFEIELPEAALAAADSLSVVAITPETGAETVLRIPSQTEQAAHSAMNAPLGKILDRLDRLLAAQHILQNGQREAAKRLIDSSKRMDELASADDGIEAGVRLVRNGQEELASRVEQLEVFLVRFDKSLGGFDERLAVLSDKHRNDLRTPLLLLAVLVGLVGGLSLGAIVW